MFITAVCVLFLIKPQWPKDKRLSHYHHCYRYHYHHHYYQWRLCARFEKFETYGCKKNWL